jgi:branched-chain amino acid transport system ATP-binding protein
LVLPESQPLLSVIGLQAGYGRKQVVFDVDLRIEPAQIVALIGHNGAGKTTTLKTIFGMLPAMGGRVVYDGADVTRSSCRQNVLHGMSLIMAERAVFGDLTVRDNLQLGALHVKSAEARAERLARVHAMFPILEERADQRAATLSGGQQRMLSLGLAIMARPRLLMLDEPSLGLAPAVVLQIFEGIRRLVDEDGISVLLLEQNIGQMLRIADRVSVMRSGRIILEESADEMRARKDYWDLF